VRAGERDHVLGGEALVREGLDQGAEVSGRRREVGVRGILARR
jgi:hypothetical protein